jgi:hypothetical protein
LERVERALGQIAEGKMLILVDDEDRENEGDLIMAASKATPQQIAFMVRHTSGVLCVPMTGECGPDDCSSFPDRCTANQNCINGNCVANPCDGVTAPRIARAEHVTWTADQARTFLDRTANDDLAAFYRLGLTLGIRIGEALALTWQDIDLTAGSLTITRTVTRTRDGRQTIGETKTASSRRRLALPAACIASLKRHKARQTAARLQAGPLWQDSGSVFTDAIAFVLLLRGEKRVQSKNIAQLSSPFQRSWPQADAKQIESVVG